MNQNRGLTIALMFVAALFWLGCSSEEDSLVFASRENKETKPFATQAPMLARRALSAAQEPATKVAAVTYLINVISNSGNEMCSGKASIEVMSDFTMKFPAAKIKCLTLTVDLAGIIGAQAANATGGLANLASDGDVLSISDVANASFVPARPLLLGPIVQDASAYRDFRKSIQTTVTVKEPGSKFDKKSATGQFDIEVIPGPNDVLTTYMNKLSTKNNFDKVLHWTMEAKGFDGIPAKNGLLLKKIEWFWNTQPVMIPKLTIVGDLAGFIETDGSQASINQLIGEVTINLAVEDWSM